jgi:hypothetical protein
MCGKHRQDDLSFREDSRRFMQTSSFDGAAYLTGGRGRLAMLRVLVTLALVVALAGCVHAPASEPTKTAAPGKKANCTPARGIDQGIGLVNGTYAAADGSIWKETNGLPHLQEIKTCEAPADTRVAPPVATPLRAAGQPPQA